MGVTSSVSEILVLSKTAKFPFRPMDYSPWSSKILINWNQLKKFMQVGIDVKCKHTDFGGCDLFGFGDIGTFKNGQISLSTHGLLQRFPRENYEGLCLLKVDILGGAQAISTLHRKASAFLIVHGHQKI